MELRRVAAIGLLAISLGACAGRAPAPVAVVQPMDNSMTCSAILAEVSSNNTEITELGSQKGAKVAQNVAAGVVGLVVWPVWFLMDFQGAAGTEIKALQDRNAYLATKVNAMDCGKEPQTEVVAREAPAYTAPAPAYAAPASTYAPPATPPVYASPAQPIYARPTQPSYQAYPTYTVPVSTVPAYAPAQGGFSPSALVTVPRYPTLTVEASAADPYAIDPYPTALVPASVPGQIRATPTY